MRQLLWPALVAILTGCATAGKDPIDKTANPESGLPSVNTEIAPELNVKGKRQLYAGIRGFLDRPPMFAEPIPPLLFERCTAIEIVSVRPSGNQMLVTAKQNNQTFIIQGLDRKLFKRTKNGRVPLLDSHFVQSLAKFNPVRNLANAQRSICSGRAWKDMTATQVLFVTGQPELRRPYKTQDGVIDVWTYLGRDGKKAQHYYFMRDKLYAWRQ